jgi:hypothetical protein
MAHASRKKIGPGTQGKGAGVGALTDTPRDKIGENQVLSNRDKKLHSDERGQDSQEIQNEQLQDNVANRLTER